MYFRLMVFIVVLVAGLCDRAWPLEPAQWTGPAGQVAGGVVVAPSVPKHLRSVPSSRAENLAPVRRASILQGSAPYWPAKASAAGSAQPGAVEKTRNAAIVNKPAAPASALKQPFPVPAIQRVARPEVVPTGKPGVKPALARPLPGTLSAGPRPIKPKVQARAVYCLDCSNDKVMIAQNISEPLPIASITKLLTAMVIIDEMDLERIVEVPADIAEVPPHKVGLRPGDMISIKDLLHGMLIESGNDCAELLAQVYQDGGRSAFMSAMKDKASKLGVGGAALYTPSGLDEKVILGRRNGRTLEDVKPNMASAKDVATIAKAAFKYPLIRRITSTKTYEFSTHNTTPRKYQLCSNVKLHGKNLPLAGAKTGYTNMAGKCIVALFKDDKTEHMVVVLNTPRHFKAAEKIYNWAVGRL